MLMYSVSMITILRKVYREENTEALALCVFSLLTYFLEGFQQRGKSEESNFRIISGTICYLLPPVFWSRIRLDQNPGIRKEHSQDFVYFRKQKNWHRISLMGQHIIFTYVWLRCLVRARSWFFLLLGPLLWIQDWNLGVLRGDRNAKILAKGYFLMQSIELCLLWTMGFTEHSYNQNNTSIALRRLRHEIPLLIAYSTLYLRAIRDTYIDLGKYTEEPGLRIWGRKWSILRAFVRRHFASLVSTSCFALLMIGICFLRSSSALSTTRTKEYIQVRYETHVNGDDNPPRLPHIVFRKVFHYAFFLWCVLLRCIDLNAIVFVSVMIPAGVTVLTILELVRVFKLVGTRGLFLLERIFSKISDERDGLIMRSHIYFLLGLWTSLAIPQEDSKPATDNPVHISSDRKVTQDKKSFLGTPWTSVLLLGILDSTAALVGHYTKKKPWERFRWLASIQSRKTINGSLAAYVMTIVVEFSDMFSTRSLPASVSLRRSILKLVHILALVVAEACIDSVDNLILPLLAEVM